MLPALRTTAIATVTALSLALSTAAPAQALGKNERNFLKGLAAVAVIGAILNDVNKKAEAQPRYVEPRYVEPQQRRHQPRYAEPKPYFDHQKPRHQEPRYADPDPRYQTPRYQEPRYVEPTPRYQQPRYQEPQRQPGRIIGSINPAPQVQGTPASRVFATYSSADRRAIQRNLARYGYYRGGIDGAFGPGTYNALAAYARDVNQSGALATNGGVYGLYDSLI